MIPLWKLRREWARLKQQIAAIPEAVTEPAARRRHDAAFEAGFPWYAGSVAQTDKIALLLVFQPNGITPGTVATCAHLAAKGYAPFIVSNAPLSRADRESLEPVAWRILERPNFGYDFGGYRDGIRQLAKWGFSSRLLLIMNDSIWFPLDTSETLIETLEASDADLTGTILRQRGKIRFLESYCYMIPQKTVSSKAFQAYWEQLQLTSNKYKVIRRGERGFSEAMIAAGLDVRGLFPYDLFVERLAAQDDAFLRKTLDYGAHVYEEYETVRRALLAEAPAPDWRNRALTHIRDTIPREQPYSAYPFAMTRLFDYPILKKSGDRVAQLWRNAYLRAVEAGDLPRPSSAVWEELRKETRPDTKG